MSTIWLSIVDSDYKPITEAEVSAFDGEKKPIELRKDDTRWVGETHLDNRITIAVSAQDFEPENHTISLHDAVTQIIIGLRKPGQLSYNYGDNRLSFTPVDDAFLARIRGEGVSDKFSAFAEERRIEWRHVSPTSPHADDDIFVRISGDIDNVMNAIRQFSGEQFKVEFYRTIEHGERLPLGLGNEIVVCFQNQVKRPDAEQIAENAGLQIVRELPHAGNAFVLASKGEPSYEIIKSMELLLRNNQVIYIEPNLTFAVEPDRYTPNDPLWGQVPHLQLIGVDDAWDRLDDVNLSLRGGSPDITIAVIDPHGVTPDHRELTANLTDGTGKQVVSMNFAAAPAVAQQTVATLGGDHGTQCAGSATAAFDDNRGIPGVAPNCHLIGARIGSASNSVLMADIYLWVGGFLNGSITPGFPTTPPSRAADVISSSWGSDGVALSNTIRDCFIFLTTYGRAGKGCVLCFSLGNTGYIDFTVSPGTWFRAWPTYEKTLAVGASINTNPTNPVNSVHPDPNGSTTNIATAVDTRSLYSPYGATALRKPDLVAPSHTAYRPGGGWHDPILSLVRVSTGSVNGCPAPATACNDYASTFGGTSHTTPTVAGAVALILSARPSLNWVQVREILRETCMRIDSGQTNAIGRWQDLDGDTVRDYSRWYGAGRINVNAAIVRALDPMLQLADVYVRDNISDLGSVVPPPSTWWESPDIWVSQDSSAPIPTTLAWTDSPPHQNAIRNRDNAVFCRVRNRGTAPAGVVYVRAMITHWGGMEFVYPNNFRPRNNVGAAIPSPLIPASYLIDETRINNLAPGADQIVKFIWAQNRIPPETVVVNGATVRWHPCLLVEVSPHDGPSPMSGLPVHVRDDNNIAQRNIEIINPGDSDSDAFIGMVAGTGDKSGVATLLLDASKLRDATSIKLHLADAEAMKLILSGAKPTEREQPSPVPPSMSLVKYGGIDAIEIKGLDDKMEIPLRLDGGSYTLLLVAVEGKPTGNLHITQRLGDGQLSGGYGIRWAGDKKV